MSEENEVKAEIVKPEALRPNPAITYIAGLPSELSRRTQRNALEVLARKFGATDAFSFDWSALRYEHVVVIQTWLVENKKPATARRYVAAVKGVLRTAYRMRLITAEEYQRAVDVPAVRGKSLSGRMLVMDEIRALLETCRTGARLRGVRDAAIISLMAGCGLRLREVTTLSVSDFHPESGQLTVHGKGRKERYAFVADGARDALDAWLVERGPGPGPIFYAIIKSDELMHRSMSGISVWAMLKERGQQAGLAPFTPHDLRRSFISYMLDLTDLATTSQLAGHSDVQTTAEYDRRSMQHVREAAGLLKIPYVRRDEP